jgi:hypothetical protein
MKVKDILKTLWERFKQLLRGFLNEDVPTPTPTPEKPVEPVVVVLEPIPTPVPQPVPPTPVTPPEPTKPVEPEIVRGYNGYPQTGGVWDTESRQEYVWFNDGEIKTFTVVVPEGFKGYAVTSVPTPRMGYPTKPDGQLRCSLGGDPQGPGYSSWRSLDVQPGSHLVTFTSLGLEGGLIFQVDFKK